MYNNLHFSRHNFKAKFRVSYICIDYLRCRLVEGIKIFPVCVIDQLSDHFGILWYGHIMN